jgi:YggT family protein
LASLINLILDLFIIAIVARVILSFIIPLSGARPHPIVVSINTMVNQVTEPILGPIRRNLPSFGGFDFSPMAVLIVIWLLRAEVVSRI